MGPPSLARTRRPPTNSLTFTGSHGCLSLEPSTPTEPHSPSRNEPCGAPSGRYLHTRPRGGLPGQNLQQGGGEEGVVLGGGWGTRWSGTPQAETRPSLGLLPTPHPHGAAGLPRPKGRRTRNLPAALGALGVQARGWVPATGRARQTRAPWGPACRTPGPGPGGSGQVLDQRDACLDSSCPRGSCLPAPRSRLTHFSVTYRTPFLM